MEKWKETVNRAVKNRELLKDMSQEEKTRRYVHGKIKQMMKSFEATQTRFEKGYYVHDEAVFSTETDLYVSEQCNFTREHLWKTYSEISSELYCVGLEVSVNFEKSKTYTHEEVFGEGDLEPDYVSLEDEWDYMVIKCSLPKKED